MILFVNGWSRNIIFSRIHMSFQPRDSVRIAPHAVSSHPGLVGHRGYVEKIWDPRGTLLVAYPCGATFCGCMSSGTYHRYTLPPADFEPWPGTDAGVPPWADPASQPSYARDTIVCPLPGCQKTNDVGKKACWCCGNLLP